MIEFLYEKERRAVAKVYDTAGAVSYEGAIESITRVGSTATVTKKNHGYSNGKALTIAGADDAAYNGAITVGGATTDTFTYTVSGTPATPATGNLSLKDTEQSLWMTLPEIISLTTITAGVTLKIEVAVRLSLGWTQVGADYTSTDSGKNIAISGKYNFVRVRRTAGAGAVVAHAQY